MTDAPLQRIRAVIVHGAALAEDPLSRPGDRPARSGISRRCCMLAAALCLGPAAWVLSKGALAQRRTRGGCLLTAAQGTLQGLDIVSPHTIAEWPAIEAAVPR